MEQGSEGNLVEGHLVQEQGAGDKGQGGEERPQTVLQQAWQEENTQNPQLAQEPVPTSGPTICTKDPEGGTDKQVQGESAKPGQCRVRSVVYQNCCKPYQTQGSSTRYIGETGRTMLERSKENHRDALAKNNKSHMREHMVTEHTDKLVDVLEAFRMTIIKPCPSALTR